MNKYAANWLAAAALLGFATAAMAQDQKAPAGAPAAATAKPVAIPDGVYLKRQAPGQFLGRDRLLGQYVKNRQGETIGQIEDIIFSGKNDVEGVIIGVGGFLGVGEKRIGVAYEALSFTNKDGGSQISLNASKEQLAGVAAFERLQPRKSALERAKEKGQVLLEQGKEVAQKGLEAAKPMLDKAKEAAKPMMDKAKEAVGTAAEKAKEAVKGAGEPKKE